MYSVFAVMGEETWAGGMAGMPSDPMSIQEKRNVPSSHPPQTP